MAATSGGLALKGVQDATQLAAQVNVVATGSEGVLGNNGVVALPRIATSLALELDVTAAATAAGDTLDVFVGTKFDGTNFIDVCHFTQVLGNGGAKRYIAKLALAQAEAMFEKASALAAATVRNIVGDYWQVRWVIVTATNPQFTFNVWATPM